MANTRQSAKRAGQAKKRQARNTMVKSATRTAIRDAVEAIQKKDLAGVKEAYTEAVRALAKAASKGVIPKTRADRKISRLTLFLKKAGITGVLSTGSARK
jgi:small subunit ribosomal protein S20